MFGPFGINTGIQVPIASKGLGYAGAWDVGVGQRWNELHRLTTKEAFSIPCWGSVLATPWANKRFRASIVGRGTLTRNASRMTSLTASYPIGLEIINWSYKSKSNQYAQMVAAAPYPSNLSWNMFRQWKTTVGNIARTRTAKRLQIHLSWIPSHHTRVRLWFSLVRQTRKWKRCS